MKIIKELFVVFLLQLLSVHSILLWEEKSLNSKDKTQIFVLETAISSLHSYLKNIDVYANKLVSFEQCLDIYYRLVFAIQINETSGIDMYSILIHSDSELNTLRFRAMTIQKIDPDRKVSLHDSFYIEIHQSLIQQIGNKLNRTIQGVSSIMQYMSDYIIHVEIDTRDKVYIMHTTHSGKHRFIEFI